MCLKTGHGRASRETPGEAEGWDAAGARLDSLGSALTAPFV